MGWRVRFHFAMGRACSQTGLPRCVWAACPVSSKGHLEANKTMIVHRSILANTDSPLAATGGQNGAGSQDPREVLAAMLTQRDAPAQPVTETSPPDSAEESPEEPPAPTQAEEPGQELSTSEEETPVAEPETQAAGEAENENEPNAGADDKGWQKRVDKLTAQKYAALEAAEAAKAEVERLKAEVEEARGDRPAAIGDRTLPETVTKLKTPAEVQARLQAVDQQLDALQDFLDANPGDAATVHQLGDKEMTRQDLLNWRATLRSEAKALPQRGQELAAAAQFSQKQQQLRSKFAEEFTWFTDKEAPQTKAIAERLKTNPFLKQFASPEYAAHLWNLGEKAIQSERAARTKGAKPLTMTPPKPVNGKVPPGKPHAANGSAGSRGAGDVKSIVSRHAQERSTDSFTALLSATGR